MCQLVTDVSRRGCAVLLINFPSLGANEAGDAIRFIFRWGHVLIIIVT